METRKVVWRGEFDHLYEVSVYRSEPYKGELIVQNIRTEEILLKEETGISYDAVFGPDYNDVEIWKQKALDVVDNLPESKCPF